jgi:uncharacterized protein DUF6636
MRRILLLAALLAVAISPAAASGFVTFHSPSGNIRCSIFKTGVRCDIQQKGFHSPPKPKGCEFDWGQSVGIGRSGKAHFECVSDAIDPGPVLAYGDSIARHRFRCKSISSGVRCVNKRNGRGFKLSRESYRFF